MSSLSHSSMLRSRNVTGLHDYPSEGQYLLCCLPQDEGAVISQISDISNRDGHATDEEKLASTSCGQKPAGAEVKGEPGMLRCSRVSHKPGIFILRSGHRSKGMLEGPWQSPEGQFGCRSVLVLHWRRHRHINPGDAVEVFSCFVSAWSSSSGCKYVLYVAFWSCHAHWASSRPKGGRRGACLWRPLVLCWSFLRSLLFTRC